MGKWAHVNFKSASFRRDHFLPFLGLLRLAPVATVTTYSLEEHIPVAHVYELVRQTREEQSVPSKHAFAHTAQHACCVAPALRHLEDRRAQTQHVRCIAGVSPPVSPQFLGTGF